MFAKIFGQIFDSSIAEDHIARHVFMDLLVLCDREGVVDMTPEAISRRTNQPIDQVLHGLCELSKPDQRSRSKLEDGARIALLDSHRDWGWQIVNYHHYRSILDEEARREYFRDKKRQYRMSKTVRDIPKCPTNSTQAEAEAEAEAKEETPPLSPSRGKKAKRQLPQDFHVTEEHREWAKKHEMPQPDSHFEEFCDYHRARANTMADWNLTFYTWLRNAKKFEARRNGGNGNGKESRFDASCRAIEEAASELADRRRTGQRPLR